MTTNPNKQPELCNSFMNLSQNLGENRRSFDAQSVRLLSLKHDMTKNSPNYIFNANNLVTSYIRHQPAGPLQPIGSAIRPAPNHFSLCSYPNAALSRKISVESAPENNCPITYSSILSQREQWAQNSSFEAKKNQPKRPEVNPKKINYQQIMREQRENRARTKRKTIVRSKWKTAYEKIVQDRRARRQRIYEIFEKVCHDLLKKYYMRKEGKVSDQYGALVTEMNKVLHSDWTSKQRSEVKMSKVFDSIDQKHKNMQAEEMMRTVVSSVIF